MRGGGRIITDRRGIAPSLLRLGRRIRATIWKVPVDEEVEEELSFHLEMRVREYEARGADPAEARRRAAAGFGDMDRLKARCGELGRERERTMERRAHWDELRQDVRFGLRQLRRSPLYATVAVVTLAVGIGATTAVFSVVDGVLLKPLPYEDPDEVVALWTRYLPSSGLDIPQFELSGPEVLDYREQSRAMGAVAPYGVGSVTLGADDGPARIGAAFVDHRLLPLLDVRPALGRVFTEEDDLPGAAGTAVLSHGMWKDRFGGDPGVIGRTITVDGETGRVVGVMPEGFAFPTAEARIFFPLGLDEQSPGGRASHGLRAVGRLAPGVTLEEARAELEAITAAWNDEFEHHAMGHFIFLRPLRDDLVGPVRETLLLLFAAMGLVLLIVCVNVANLQLARTERRHRELGVRAALGAGGGRLVRQLLSESLLLALLGGGLGLALAWWATGAVTGIDPTAVPRLEEVGVDVRVVLFAAGLAVLTALLFGAAPGIRAGRGRHLDALRGEAKGSGGRDGARFRRVLVGVEAAVGVVVVVGAALVGRSYWELSRVDPGIDPEGVLTSRVSLPRADYPSAAEAGAFWDAFLERAGAVPGVDEVSVLSRLPFTGGGSRWDFLPEGRPPPPPGVPVWNAKVTVGTPGLFPVLGIPVRRGRIPERTASEGAPVVVAVNETAARRFWPGEDPIGRRVTFDMGAEDPAWLPIVAVVGDVRADGLDAAVPDQMYVLPTGPLESRSFAVAARTSGDPRNLTSAFRAVLGELDPTLPLSDVRTLEGVVGASVARSRLAAILLAAFAAVGLFLAAIGIYGVVAYSVARRTREIGIRAALGAERDSLVRLMVREGALPASLGIAGGLAVAFLVAGLIRDLLFRVDPRDPATFLLLPALLGGVALLASWIPARRATRISPTEALRAE